MEGIQIRDFLRYRYISRLALSPDRKAAAFTVSAADEKSNGYKRDIWVYRTDGGKCIKLTSGGNAGAFFWDGNDSLIFTSVRDDSDRESVKNGDSLTVFYRIALGGGEAEECFRIERQVSSVKPAGDGRYAVICRYDPNHPDMTGLDEAAKEAARKKLKDEGDYEVLDEIPFWSNGEGFTNKIRSRLHMFDPSSGALTAVTDELTDVERFEVRDGRILYISNRYSDKMELENGVYSYGIATGGTEEIIAPGGMSISYADTWKDGYIILGSYMTQYGLNEYGNFYTISGAEAKPELLCELDEDVGDSTGSDCRLGPGNGIRKYNGEIFYSTVNHTKNLLKKLNRAGQIETVLEPETSVDGFDIFEDGVLYYGLGPLALQELYSYSDGGTACVSFFNSDALSDRELSPPEYIEAAGEVTIEGYVIKPVGFEPGKKYPAVLNIHGGPKTAFGDTFFHEMQVWAAKGYFVLFCNPRGSDGRGDDFADIRGKYGTIDYDDLMLFTDECIRKYPGIDESRLAVAGGSYGGYMTNWIIGHTDRFCCAASQRSISNWVSKFGTTDIGYFFNADQIGATPWSDADKLWWHSPLKYADRAKTPTLFIHSDEDYRCWLAEGLQMFTALKYNGVKARLCLFHGENHELSRSGKPAHRVRRMEEICGWFEKYMG